jgi:hypothetical protein
MRSSEQRGMGTDKDRDSGSEEEGKVKRKEHLIKLRDTGDDNEMVAVREEEDLQHNNK